MINKTIGSIAIVLLCSTSVIAAESLFAFTPGVDTIPKKQSEIAFDIANLRGERLTPSSAVTFSTSYERGVGDNLSVTATVGGFAVDHDENAFGATLDANGVANPHIPAFSETGLSRIKVGVQRRILSPYTDMIGVALRGEFAFDWFEDEFSNTKTKQYSLRPSLLVQKNYMDDMLNLGANLAADLRYGCQKPSSNAIGLSVCQDEIIFQPSLGAAYRFAPNWNFGVEGFYRKRISDQSDSPGSLFIGPSLHYGAKRWYATAAVHWQVAGSAAYVEPTSIQYSSNATRLTGEREMRLRIGVNL